MMMRHIIFCLFALLLSLSGRALAASRPILFLSDFGTLDDAVPICKGIMLEVSPSLTIIDVTHDVQPFSILDGARFLANTSRYYSKAVFVAVVDPGVGSDRKALVVKSKNDHFFVLPDNGLITFVEDKFGIQGIREIQSADWIRKNQLSSTFHGRDILAPVAARLARGDNWESVGPLVTTHVRLEILPPKVSGSTVQATVIATDGPYGNLITNLETQELMALGVQWGTPLTVKFGKQKLKIPYVRTFSSVPNKMPLAYSDSTEHLAFAINMGNFSKKYAITPPTPVEILLNK